jgi:hypothetical protein
MKRVALFIIAILLASGCTQTGQPVDRENLGFVEREDVGNITGNGPIKHNVFENITLELVREPCQGVTCENTVKKCPNGTVLECENHCLPDEGVCTECDIECVAFDVQTSGSGGGQPEPQAPPEPVCDRECSICQRLEMESCECLTEFDCDGNLICEEGEYPDSGDCPDCDDQDNCTEDGYNFSTESCEHIFNCTEVPVEESNLSLIITEIMYNPVQDENYNEWIEIFNPSDLGVNLSEWELCNVSVLPGYVNLSGEIEFINSYTIDPLSYGLITDGGSGSDVYENFLNGTKPVFFHVDAGSLCNRLSNSGERVWLSDPSGGVVFQINYTGLTDCTEGHSLEKRDNWSCSESEGGTPGY